MNYIKTKELIEAINKLPLAREYPYNECEVPIIPELDIIKDMLDNSKTHFKTLRFIKVNNEWNLLL